MPRIISYICALCDDPEPILEDDAFRLVFQMGTRTHENFFCQEHGALIVAGSWPLGSVAVNPSEKVSQRGRQRAPRRTSEEIAAEKEAAAAKKADLDNMRAAFNKLPAAQKTKIWKNENAPSGRTPKGISDWWKEQSKG